MDMDGIEVRRGAASQLECRTPLTPLLSSNHLRDLSKKPLEDELFHRLAGVVHLGAVEDVQKVVDDEDGGPEIDLTAAEVQQ